MPELPEVETVARYVSEKLSGKTVVGAEVNWERSIGTPDSSVFLREIVGCKVLRAWRRGKFIVIDLSNGRNMLVHLRMSGDLQVKPANAPARIHDRVLLRFARGQTLHFYDPRKFGRIYLVDNYAQVTRKLGIEPLSDDFTVERLGALFSKRKTRVKNFLLDQRFVAGLGNIYAVESLWAAEIHPLTQVARIPRRKIIALHSAIRKILSNAVASAGTDLGDGVWKYGGYRVKAYGRAGKPCPRCKATLRRIVIAQRGSDYCPCCQRRR